MTQKPSKPSSKKWLKVNIRTKLKRKAAPYRVRLFLSLFLIMTKDWKSRTPWREKLLNGPTPHAVEIPIAWQKKMGTGQMLIPNPLLIHQLVRQIPEGMLTTMNELRAKLAADHQMQTACPLTTGIFLKIAAYASREAQEEGRINDVIPFWRVIKGDRSLSDKLPGGIAFQKEHLMKEGHAFKGNKWIVDKNKWFSF